MSRDGQEDGPARAATRRDTLVTRLARAAGLRLVTPGDLTLRRRRRGTGFSYVDEAGRPVDAATRRRLERLAVPPGYADVAMAADPAAHIQAIGTDAAGRLQYRYHADWDHVREALKARRLSAFIDVLPTLRRGVHRSLAAGEPTRDMALAAAIRLIEISAIRIGNDTYERLSGNRGASTLRKSNVRILKGGLSLDFRAKGGKRVSRHIEDAALADACRRMARLPGPRLFQYRAEDGAVKAISAGDINAWLRQTAGKPISAKDFRTLVASARAVELLAGEAPAPGERSRRSQILTALRAVADDLANTPAVARKSYVHASVIDAFERGRLQRLGRRVKAKPFSPRCEQMLLRIVRAATPAWEGVAAAG